MRCGIYLIAFGDRLYIGSSQRIEQRWRSHRRELRQGVHHNRFMQRLHDNGVKPVFAVVMLCAASELLKREQAAIDAVEPELNLALIAGAPMRGRAHSDATRARMHKSDAQRLAQSNARKGQPGRPCSPELRARHRLAHPMRKAVRCVETGAVFHTHAAAADWVRAQGLTRASNAQSNISGARRGVLKTAYGYSWVDI